MRGSSIKMGRLIREAGAPLGEQEVIDICRGRIAGVKITRRVNFVEQCPLSGSGKIQKHLLRAETDRGRSSSGGPDRQ